jgi:DNA replication and repair protein RecF
MILHQLDLENYRNINRQTVYFRDGVNVITGANAQGKTNLLEAAAYWSAARSHRTARDEELIQTGKPHAWLRALFSARGRGEQTLEASLLLNGQRRHTHNGVPIRTVREMVGILPSVLFAPGDLALVQEGPALRRKLLDTVLCQLSPVYMSALSRYNKVLKQKQKLLRGRVPGDMDLYAAYNAQLSRYGAVLIPQRAKLVVALSKLAAGYHSGLSRGRETLSLHYKTVSAVRDPYIPAADLEVLLNAHYALRLPAEIACQFCLTGPQRDNFLLNINEKNQNVFASQGQARTAAIAVKMAERACFMQELGEPPLLLLDDVLSELDEHRRRVVLTELTQGQVLLTCCDSRRTRFLSGHVIRVKAGVYG